MADSDRKLCPQCLVYFNPCYIQRHVATPHAQCPNCRKTFMLREFNKHVRVCGVAKVSGCERCEKKFPTTKALRQHERLKHTTCEACGRGILEDERAHHALNCEARRPEVDVEACLVVNNMGREDGADVESYMRKAEGALARSRSLMEELLAKAQPTSRFKDDGESFLKYLNDATLGEAMTAAEATATMSKTGNAPLASTSHNFIICTDTEARTLLEKGPPRLPILIPRLANTPKQHLTIDGFLSQLLDKEGVDIHDLSLASADTSSRAAVSKTSEDAITLFQSRRAGKGMPVNMLNLNGTKHNPVPPCLANQSNYRMLDQPHGVNKKTDVTLGDLDQSTSFHLLASQGALHLEHIDRHGVVTTVFNDMGEKLWLCWPGLSIIHRQLIINRPPK